jgi:hypothetical protein
VKPDPRSVRLRNVATRFGQAARRDPDRLAGPSERRSVTTRPVARTRSCTRALVASTKCTMYGPKRFWRFANADASAARSVFSSQTVSPRANDGAACAACSGVAADLSRAANAATLCSVAAATRAPSPTANAARGAVSASLGLHYCLLDAILFTTN